jgi:hypothetical protein
MLAGTAVLLLYPAALSAQQPDEPTENELQPPSLVDLTEPPPPPSPLAAITSIGALHGTVRNSVSGDPIPRAQVRIEGDAQAGALTDGQGRFEIPDVPTGPQSVLVLKPGFRDPMALPQQNLDAGVSIAHNVLVASPMPDVIFDLTPTASIHGQVQLSTGDPASGIAVCLLHQMIQHGRPSWAEAKSVRTDTGGNYRFGNLPQGVYVVFTRPELESAPATTLVEPGRGRAIVRNGYPVVFAPDARNLSAASRIRLNPGDAAQANISLTLEPFFTFTAALLPPVGKPMQAGSDAVSGKGASLPTPQILDADNHILPYAVTYDDATHTVQADLPDGNYNLTVVLSGDASTNPGGDASYPHPSFLVGAAQFSVADRPVNDLVIPLFPPHSFPLALRALPSASSAVQSLPRQSLTSAVHVALEPYQQFIDSSYDKSALPFGPDSLDLMLAPPYDYWVHTLVMGKGLCAGSFQANGPNLAHEPLTLSFSSSSAIAEFTLRGDCATLNLSLPPALSAFVPGVEPFYTVYIVPDFDTTEDVEPQTLRPSSGGSLSIEALTPGSYHVYTFTAPVELEYRNPDAIAQLGVAGQAVTLLPGANANLVLEVPEGK